VDSSVVDQLLSRHPTSDTAKKGGVQWGGRISIYNSRKPVIPEGSIAQHSKFICLNHVTS
jgi:hypothetical protein